MNRITLKDLENVIRLINQTTGHALKPYEWIADDSGKKVFTPNGGNYHLDGAYGGYKLAQVVYGGGSGTRDVLHCGYTTKRDLHGQLTAYLAGLDAPIACEMLRKVAEAK